MNRENAVRTPAHKKRSTMFVRYLLVGILLTTLPITAVNIAYMSHLQRGSERDVCRANWEALSRDRNMIESMLASVSKLANSLSASEFFLRLGTLEQPVSTRDYVQRIQPEMRALSDLAMQSFGFIKNITVYFSRSHMLFNLSSAANSTIYYTTAAPDDLQDQSWYRHYLSDAFQSARSHRFLSDNPWPATMLVMYPIRDSIERGVVAVEINLRALGRLLDMGGYKAFDKPFIICYERESGRLVYSYEYYYQHHPEEAEPFRQIALEGGADTGLYDVNGARMVISRQPSADDSLIYCCIAPLNAYSHIMPGTLPFCLSMLAMSLLLDALMALILANWIYQPISGIVRAVRAYPHAIPDDHQKSELDEIRDHIIQMQNENDLQREKVDEYIELLQNAQMNALQSQINPHFLYNTLESIADRMIMLANGENICSDMLLLLARLLRISLNTRQMITPLREEIDQMNLYIQLMSFRTRNAIEWAIDIPPALMERRVLKLSLQPIVENAIEHGLRPRRYRGKITITAREENGELFIEVADNGVGMPAAQRDELNRRLFGITMNAQQHIGLLNVNHRLKLIYGMNNAGLRIESTEGEGTRVLIRYGREHGALRSR